LWRAFGGFGQGEEGEMRRTAFYDAAIEIGNDIDRPFAICELLYDKPMSKRYFTNLFKPKSHEMALYKHRVAFWMSEWDCPLEQGNDLRILALLLCHEIYLSENP
jgi:hypothetical protein